MSKRVAAMTPAEQEKARAYNRAWLAANPEKMRGLKRAWRAANTGAVQSYNAAWRAANPGYLRAWRAANPDKAYAGRHRVRQLRCLYGLTPEQFDSMSTAQGDACAVCGAPFADMKKRPHVDHCHKTGKVRALLCHRCNTAIGLARDCPDILRGLAAYLEHHRGEE